MVDAHQQQVEEGVRRRAALRADTARAVRAIADQMTTPERGMLLAEVVRAVYDSEKFTGLGGEGLDGRDSAARRAMQEVSNVAQRAAEVTESQTAGAQIDRLIGEAGES